MKKLLITLAAGLFAVSSVSASSDDFVFANDTNGTVVGLYVSPHGYKKWLHNVLHESLDPDEYTQVYFPEEPDYDVYDVRVDFPSEHYDFTSGYNLSTISRIWITYNGNHNVSLNWK
jgi:hypothetical protein